MDRRLGLGCVVLISAIAGSACTQQNAASSQGMSATPMSSTATASASMAAGPTTPTGSADSNTKASGPAAVHSQPSTLPSVAAASGAGGALASMNTTSTAAAGGAPALDKLPAAGSGEAAGADKLDAGTMAAADGGKSDGPLPPKQFLPPASGPCPEFQNGYVMFAPDGMQRRVLLYMSDAAKTKDGPLVFSWHSTLPNPEDATSWIGRSQIEEIKALGGIVAAPTTGYPNETRPWDNTPMGAQGVDGDQRLMDEIVACANEKVGIDLRRIYATGMSAGGLKSAQVSLRRSGYLASVVVYSGGLTEGDMPPDQDPNNKLAAMIFYGGPTDISPVDGINYTDASNRYRDLMRSKGRLAFLCNHGGGHSVPQDSQASAWQFMQDHPYGVTPDPYAKALPSGFLRYCSLTP